MEEITRVRPRFSAGKTCGSTPIPSLSLAIVRVGRSIRIDVDETPAIVIAVGVHTVACDIARQIVAVGLGLRAGGAQELVAIGDGDGERTARPPLFPVRFRPYVLAPPLLRRQLTLIIKERAIGVNSIIYVKRCDRQHNKNK